MLIKIIKIILLTLLLASSNIVSAEYGWQVNETNTGLAGVGLTCDSLPTYTGPEKPTAGTTITLQKITYPELILSNGNITLDRVCVKPTSAGNRMSIVFGYNPDTAGNQLGDVTIKDSDIDGSLITNDGVYTACGFRGAGSVYRTKISGLGNGICYFGSSTVPSSVIEENYVFNLRGGMYGSPSQQSHNESGTIRAFDGTSLIWRNNKLISLTGSDSGALFIQTISGNVRNVVIEGNYFETAAWNLALEAAYGNTYSAMQAINNRFNTSGGLGAAYVSDGPGWDVWYNNFIYNSNDADGKGAVVTCPGGTCSSIPDTTPPSTPTNLQATPSGSLPDINLSWTASTDNFSVSNYQIWRCTSSECSNFSQVGTSVGTTYSDTNLSPNTTYSYKVLATDAANNTSNYSNIVTATSANVTTTIIGRNAILSTNSVVGNNIIIAQQTTLSADATIQTISIYISSGSGNFRLGIYDATGASGGPGTLKAQTSSVAATTGWNTAAVTTPTNLVSGTYWLCFVFSSETLSTQVEASGSYKGVSYTYGSFPSTFPTPTTSDVGNASIYATLTSNGQSDILPPIITITGPSASLPINTTSTNLTLTSDEYATCKFTTLPNITFGSKNTFSTTNSTSHSQTINYLKNGNIYHYYVACSDSSNNISNDTLVSFYINTQNKRFRR